MILVPRQLRRSGMTGDVPYYGGRLTPAQAYAASHPSHPSRPPRPAPPPVPTDPAETVRTLQELLDTGVLTSEEHAELLSRVTG
jgi:hypothetical protein